VKIKQLQQFLKSGNSLWRNCICLLGYFILSHPVEMLHRNDEKRQQYMLFPSSKCRKMSLRPGLCPGPHWGSLQTSPDPLAGSMEGHFAAQGQSQTQLLRSLATALTVNNKTECSHNILKKTNQISHFLRSLMAPSFASFRAVSSDLTLSIVARNRFSSFGNSQRRSALSRTNCQIHTHNNYIHTRCHATAI